MRKLLFAVITTAMLLGFLCVPVGLVFGARVGWGFWCILMFTNTWGYIKNSKEKK